MYIPSQKSDWMKILNASERNKNQKKIWTTFNMLRTLILHSNNAEVIVKTKISDKKLGEVFLFRIELISQIFSIRLDSEFTYDFENIVFDKNLKLQLLNCWFNPVLWIFVIQFKRRVWWVLNFLQFSSIFH